LGVKLLDFEDFVKIAELSKEELTINTINKIKIIKSGMNRGRKF